jgi:hypothetical protein
LKMTQGRFERFEIFQFALSHFQFISATFQFLLHRLFCLRTADTTPYKQLQQLKYYGQSIELKKTYTPQVTLRFL